MKKYCLVILIVLSLFVLTACGKKDFTYKTDGNKITILYSGNTIPFETTYEIKDDELTIKDSYDNDTIYVRK